jgi:hypothetical protein
VFPGGFGVRTRYWQFDPSLPPENSAIALPAIPGLPAELAGARLSTTGQFRVSALDGEVNRIFEIGPWHNRIGGGLRYGAVEHDNEFQVTFPSIVPPLSVQASQNNHFYGVGPTMFVELRRRFGVSGFAFVANARGSLLFGARSNTISVSSSMPVDLGMLFPEIGTFPLTGISGSTSQDAAAGIGEIQLGIEWSRQLRSGANLFVQCAWEAQIWNGVGNSVIGASDDLGLVGVSLGVGVQR